jgi:hypothetical protein
LDWQNLVTLLFQICKKKMLNSASKKDFVVYLEKNPTLFFFLFVIGNKKKLSGAKLFYIVSSNLENCNVG